ncbi:hypothetical protein NIES2101_41875 [Calothrix sp. HK-06]|nr:hypothetical protein NIES2101_41875 [Calothrix sp. HK-06]
MLSQVSKVFTTFAFIISLTGVIAINRTKDKTLPLIITFTSGAFLGSAVSGALTASDARYEIKKSNDESERKIKSAEKDKEILETKLSKQAEDLLMSNKLYMEQTTKIALKETLIKSLQDSKVKLEQSTILKNRELDAKLAADDYRFKQFIKELKSEFQKDLKETINLQFDRMIDTINAELGKEEYFCVTEQLQKFKQHIQNSYQKYYERCNELGYVDGQLSNVVNSIADTYFRVNNSIAAVRVGHQKIKNLALQLKIEKLQDELNERSDIKKYVPYPNVLNAANNIQNHYNNKVTEIQSLVHKHNSEELRALREYQKNQVESLLVYIEQQNVLIANLQQDNDKLSQPLYFYGSAGIAEAGNKIISYYWKKHYYLDGLSWEENEQGYNMLFSIRRNPGLTANELYEGNTRELLASFVNSIQLPEFDFNRQNSTLTLKVILRTIKKSARELKFKILTEVGNKRSWLVSGHPGAGKTSVLIYLCQQLGGIEAQRIALNPHDDNYSSYEKYGFVEINNIDEIVEQIYLLESELLKRRSDKNRRFMLVVAIDELGAILHGRNDAQKIMDIIKQLATEARKLNIMLAIGLHSQTTKALKIDSEFRSAFYQLFLVGAARKVTSDPKINAGLKSDEVVWLRENAYPILLLINSQYFIVEHPTHGHYTEYKDTGNPPCNLEDWEINNLTFDVTESANKWVQNLNDEPPNQPNPTQTNPIVNPKQPNSTQTASRTQNQVKSLSGESSGFTINPTQPQNPRDSQELGSTGFNPTELELINSNHNLTVAQIIELIWNKKPSKSAEYKNLKMKVQRYINELNN